VTYGTPVRAVLIANRGDNDGGVVGRLLRERGFVCEQWAREDALEWPQLSSDVAVVVPLGSDWSVYWPDIAHLVEAEAALLRAAHQAGIPVFGICFGGQILAHALGGEVKRAEKPEIGWFSIDWTVTQVTLPAVDDAVWLQWHYDRCLPPEEAEILATSPVGVQVFRLGRSFGVQFHPEVTPQIIERWSSGPGADELHKVGISPQELCAETEKRAHTSAAHAATLVDWFFEHAT
jgi:GMP synthase-like glutamine amidotransferase